MGKSRIIKCPFSHNFYDIKEVFPFSDHQAITLTYDLLCPNDEKFYQACYEPTFRPVVFKNNMTAVCGRYFCKQTGHDRNWRTFEHGTGEDTVVRCDEETQCVHGLDEIDCEPSKQNENPSQLCKDTITIWKPANLKCNGKCDCGKCDDERECNGVSYYFYCLSASPIYSELMCDQRNDCFYGEDELGCKGESMYCKLDKNTFFTYKYGNKCMYLSNYSRCLPLIRCVNKWDQTNCSNSSLAPLKCKINGSVSTVSINVICKFEIIGNIQRQPVCDTGIDLACVKPSLGCPMLHRHKLCDNITDCTDKSDEETVICRYLTNIKCNRAYGNKSLYLPKHWINDGIQDCRNGADERLIIEEIAYYCRYGDITRWQLTECRDVFVCPKDNSVLIDIQLICDKMYKCPILQTDNLCKAYGSINTETMVNVPRYKNIYLLSYCIPGIRELTESICTKMKFPNYKVLGANPGKVILPEHPIRCINYFGELYVLLSCLGKCLNASCKVAMTTVSSETCKHDIQRRFYTISETESLVLLKKKDEVFEIRNFFQCTNKWCLSYDKVCNLVDDCGDGSDEDNCQNNFICNKNSRKYSLDYISIEKVCNGFYDCLDFSDEAGCCSKSVIPGLSLKVLCGLIGITAILANAFALTKNLCSMNKIKTKNAFLDRGLITIVEIGDSLTAGYLLSISVIDAYYRHNFCEHEMEWLSSLGCSTLGTMSTIGSQISLFSMTALSLTRAVSLTKGWSVPLPHKLEDYKLLLAYVTNILIISSVVAFVPLISVFENTFANALYFPGVSFMKVFVNKGNLKVIVETYYGRVKEITNAASWDTIRDLIHGMFTKTFDGVEEKVLHFYGNDPVCLFKYFVYSDDPQHLYSWLVLAINSCCFFLISIAYIVILCTEAQSSSTVITQQTSNAEISNRAKKLQKKVMLIILTDCACWIPFTITCFLNTAQIVDGANFYGLFSVAILPLNATINPLIYNSVTPAKLKHLFRRCYS